MNITKETVEYVAHLARIELTSQESEVLSSQLKDILDFIDKLKEVNLENIKPTSHILPINNVFRSDIAKNSLLPQKVLENAPLKEGNFFAVPKVIE